MEKIDTRTCIRRQDESISIKSVCKEENASLLQGKMEAKGENLEPMAWNPARHFTLERQKTNHCFLLLLLKHS